MNQPTSQATHVAIACGGTGGHLFPGLAVGREILRRGGRVTMFVSEKEVDRHASASATGMSIVAQPSVGLTRGRWLGFAGGMWRSARLAGKYFRENPPRVVLAMGGFTSAGPVLAGRRAGAACFLHDSNVIPGRANRWLSNFAKAIFVAFPQAGAHFKKPTEVTGTPVRAEFQPMESVRARAELGLRGDDPVLLIMGGSQGATGINRLAQEALPALVERFPRLQFIHLAGGAELATVQSAYQRLGVKALVQRFSTEMHLALGAATLALSRAGGSSLAELAVMGTATVLVPYPEAAENHQEANAESFVRQGAAVSVAQNQISGVAFAELLVNLLADPQRRSQLSVRIRALAVPDAAACIVDAMSAAAGLVWDAAPETRSTLTKAWDSAAHRNPSPLFHPAS